MAEKQFLTMRQVRKMSGTPLTAEDFVTTPTRSMPFPVIEVPGHLMSRLQAEKAEEAIGDCSVVVGAYGELGSKFESSDFLEPAKRFENATGVKAKKVFETAWMKLESMADRNGCF